MGFVWGKITYVITAITLNSTPTPKKASSPISYISSHPSNTREAVGIDVRVDFTLYFRHSTIAVSCHLNTCLDTFNGVNTLHLTSFQESFGLTWMTWHAFELLLLHLQYRQRVAASQFLANAIFSCTDTRTSSPCQLHFCSDHRIFAYFMTSNCTLLLGTIGLLLATIDVFIFAFYTQFLFFMQILWTGYHINTPTHVVSVRWHHPHTDSYPMDKWSPLAPWSWLANLGLSAGTPLLMFVTSNNNNNTNTPACSSRVWYS